MMAIDASDLPIAPGTFLDDKYLVKRSLGRGGFGEVFLAEDRLVTGRMVAIKVLRNTEVEDREDFIREMNLLARVSHPGVVTFHHHFARGDRLFLVMAHCEYGSLRDSLRTRLYPGPEAVALVAKITEALAFMHGRNVVHHDIKPENILFDADGQPRIGDFGIANRNWGTLAYMAPELLLGERTSPHDARIDIYALGVTLLELLTGINPFSDLGRENNRRRKVAHEFVPPHLDRWLQEIVLKATHPTPELRFQTADEFRSALAAKNVPFIIDRANIQAHDLALKAEKLAKRKRWDAARRRLDLALYKKPDRVAARVVAGRIALLREDLVEARQHLLEAQRLNPRASIQKELGWIHLADGEYSLAISMLTDYLQRNATDHEAYNLLLQCFYLTDRYEAGGC